MSVKKSGSIIINTVLVLFILTLIGSLCCRMMLNNKSLQNLVYIHEDKYNLSQSEEDALFDFMKIINNNIKHAKNENEDLDVKDIIASEINTNIHGYKLKYENNTDRFVLCKDTDIDSDKGRYFGRSVNYKITNDKSEKIILVPSYIFIQNQ